MLSLKEKYCCICTKFTKCGCRREDISNSTKTLSKRRYVKRKRRQDSTLSSLVKEKYTTRHLALAISSCRDSLVDTFLTKNGRMSTLISDISLVHRAPT